MLMSWMEDWMLGFNGSYRSALKEEKVRSLIVAPGLLLKCIFNVA